jgi:DNA topoisomerase-1
MTTLVVVESPSKAKKIQKMLGTDYIVQASGGHIRDLPTEEIGYNEKTLEPIYRLTERGKESVKYLESKQGRCHSVLLATDPDREGEAIAWHVAEVLDVPADKRMRVKFHEITPTAVLQAIKNPTPLDTKLVRAQEARRIIDRQVGWRVSGPLSRAIHERASAGRVQTPSLGLVVEREREITAFIKQQFYGVTIVFPGDPTEWTADWTPTGGPDTKCLNRSEAEQAANIRTYTVLDYKEGEERESPPPPFDTAVLQQAASVTLGFDPEKTMAIAQKLFQGIEEGHGLITYHRTDDVNLSDEAYQKIQQYAAAHGLPPVVSSKRRWKAGNDAQEAHEAIRPTDFEADLTGLSQDEIALYNLILRRAVASQLPDVVYKARRVKLDGNGMDFNGVGRIQIEKGWRAYGEVAEAETEGDEDQKTKVNNIPILKIGATLTAVGGRVSESWTRARGRYTKASLIKTLKALGIGRPATYAVAVDGLEKRGYVSLDGRHLVPNPVAYKIHDALTGKFAFGRVDYTRMLEESLDAIATGKRQYYDVVKAVDAQLTSELATMPAPTVHQPRQPATDTAGQTIKCPKCGKEMVERNGKNGPFYGCTGYPECKGTKTK